MRKPRNIDQRIQTMLHYRQRQRSLSDVLGKHNMEAQEICCHTSDYHQKNLQKEKNTARRKFTATIVQAILFHPDRSSFFPNWRNVKTMAGNMSFVRIVEGFELCQLSERIQFFHCMRYSVGRIIYCYCGTCLFLSEQVRQLNEKRFVFTISLSTIKKGTKKHTEGIGLAVQNGKKVIPSGQSGIKRSEGRHIFAHSRQNHSAWVLSRITDVD